MNKRNSFVKFFKNINRSINSLLEKNLNKLNFNNLINLLRNNKIILTFVALFVLFISYLLLPTFYKQADILKVIKKEVLEKYNLELKFSKDLNYNIFPRPHFTSREIFILDDQDEFSNVKKIKIFISLENIFPFKNIKINDLSLEEANFNFNNKNYNFFIQLLENNYLERSLKIKNSNVFYRNANKEVLFINKILNMKYYYDANELKNIVISENNVFNIPYLLETYLNTNNNKIFSRININFLKLQIENELSLKTKSKIGKSNFVINKSKSIATYEINKNSFEYSFFDKLDNPKFFYKGKFNFKPFYSIIDGVTEELRLSHLFDSSGFIAQLLKTEIINNKNVDFKLNISAEKIHDNLNFKNVKLISKIQEGLIDMDKTKFEWKNFAKFKLLESLIYIKDGELVLDGKIEINIKNYNDIYKYLLTPKSYRNKIKKVDFNFTYNFDQNLANLKDIKIDNKINNNVNKILNSIVLKKDKLQNKIYLKNLLNEAIKSYAG